MIAIPVAGIAQVYAVPTASTTSDGSNYHTIKALRAGQDESGVSVNTSVVELTAYQRVYLGRFVVGQGDVITLQVSVTGTPSPELSNANFVLQCELTPRASAGRAV